MWKVFVSVILFSVSVQAEDSLVRFCDRLDKSLRQARQSEATCHLKENTRLPYRTAVYEGHTATVMSEADAQLLFKELKGHKEIPYEFSYGGCETRAHEMARIMTAKGITPLKAFAVVDERTSNILTAPHPKDKTKSIRWKYHTTPLILVEKNGKIEPYTLDPSLESKAVPIPQWKNDMIRHNPKTVVEIRIAPATQLLPEARPQVSFTDAEFNKNTAETLKRYKQWASDPDGEELYRQEIEYNERQSQRMDSY